MLGGQPGAPRAAPKFSDHLPITSNVLIEDGACGQRITANFLCNGRVSKWNVALRVRTATKIILPLLAVSAALVGRLTKGNLR